MPTEFLEEVKLYIRLDTYGEKTAEELNIERYIGRFRVKYNGRKVEVQEYDDGSVILSFWEGDLLAGRADDTVCYCIDSDAKEVAKTINEFLSEL